MLPDGFKGYYLAYINEYSYIVERYLDRPILLYDSFYLSKDNIKNAQVVSGIEKSDIYIICFKFIIKYVLKLVNSIVLRYNINEPKRFELRQPIGF